MKLIWMLKFRTNARHQEKEKNMHELTFKTAVLIIGFALKKNNYKTAHSLQLNYRK